MLHIIPKNFTTPLEKFPIMKNTPEEISEVRVRALEALIRCEGHLEHRMYECADFYAHNKDSQDVKDLYTLWSGWKEKFPRTAYEQINRL